MFPSLHRTHTAKNLSEKGERYLSCFRQPSKHAAIDPKRKNGAGCGQISSGAFSITAQISRVFFGDNLPTLPLTCVSALSAVVVSAPTAVPVVPMSERNSVAVAVVTMAVLESRPEVKVAESEIGVVVGEEDW